MNELLDKMNLTPTRLSEAVKSAPEPVTQSRADVLWDKFKDVDLNMFGLPNQLLKDYCDPVAVEPSKLYLSLKKHKQTATSIVHSLEAAVGDKFVVNMTTSGLYIISDVVGS